MALRLVRCLLIAFAALALMAETGANAQQPENDQLASVQRTVEAAERDIERIRADIADEDIDEIALTELKTELDGFYQSMLDAAISLRAVSSEVRLRLDQLGPPPAEGEPEEPALTAEERKELGERRAEINSVTGSAERVTIAARQLTDAITELRRVRFAETLLRRTPLTPALLGEAASALVVEVGELGQTIQSWLRFVFTFKLQPLLTALALSMLAGLIFVVGARRVFGGLFLRDPGIEQPGYIARLLIAFWSTLIPTLAVAAFLASSYFLMKHFNVLRDDISRLILLAFEMAGAVYFLSKLSRAVLAPGMPAWRLVDLSNEGARVLYRIIVLMALVNGLDYFLSGLSQTLGSPFILTVMKSMFASVIIGVILIVASYVSPMVAADGDPAKPGRPWPSVVALPLRIAGFGLIVAVLLGYIGLGRFVATQIVITGSILVMMYIGILSGRAISEQHSFGATFIGRQLTRQFDIGPVALDQIGLIAGLGIYLIVFMFGIPMILLQWGFQVDDIRYWLVRLLTEIRIGNFSISVTALLLGILLFVVGLFATRGFQKWLDGSVMARSQVDIGVRHSIKTGIGYLGVAVAALIGVSAAGISLSNLALVAGALSLGIGFGLQNVVSNFVSGLILLVERPFKVGDWVVTGSAEGFVKRISVRATEIETFQRQTIIVPNSEFINSSLGNWTHRNTFGRAEVKIGVAYGSDPRKVMDILMELALAHELVLRNPEPMVVFQDFGASSLDFELRVYLADVLTGLGVRNDLRVAIFERFREEGIEIPFPQSDVHVRFPTGDASAATAMRETLTEGRDGAGGTIGRVADEGMGGAEPSGSDSN